MIDRRLTHVVALARAGSFSKAAENQGITQSGMTRSIADLEREIGYALFHRTPRGVTPTERGRDFVERAAQILQDTRALLTETDEENDAYARSLRIGVSPSSLEWRLAEPLAALLRKHPALRFDVVGSTVERCVHLLRSGAVDVAIGFEDALTDWSDLKLTVVGTVNPVLFVRKGHDILTGKGISRSDLALLDCVMPSDSRPVGNVLRELFEEEGVSWTRHLHVTDNQLIVQRLIGSSNAFGITSTQVASAKGFSDIFDTLPVEGLFRPFNVCCATRARWELSKPVLAFLRVMQSVAPGGYSLDQAKIQLAETT